MKNQDGFTVKVQQMRSKKQQPRYYVYIPVALADALGIVQGELVRWELLDRDELHLIRTNPPQTSTQLRVEK